MLNPAHGMLLPGAVLAFVCAAVLPAAHAPTGSGATPPGSATPAASPVIALPTEITITVSEMRFSPDDIVIPANTPVTVHLRNTGGLIHDFSSNELRLSPDARPGQTIDFTLDAPAGTYAIYCSLPGHKGAGMTATLHAVDLASPVPVATPAR